MSAAGGRQTQRDGFLRKYFLISSPLYFVLSSHRLLGSHVNEPVVAECFISGFEMIHNLHFVIIWVIFSLLPRCPAANNSTSAVCQRVCGETQVPFPFGFSDGCGGIRLNCSGGGAALGSITIGGFIVQNLTNDQILVRLPAQCNRSIGDLGWLFGPNFAPTWRNAFLLDNCREPLNACMIPGRLLRSMIAADCVVDNVNVNCYSGMNADNNTADFLDYGIASSRGNCTVLLSSITSVFRRNGVSAGTGSMSVALDFQMAELGWWVGGACDCDPNAYCTPVIYGNQTGYRCNCNAGFVGDGFLAGEGCRRVSVPGNSRRVFILVGAILAGALSMAVLIVTIYCLKKRSGILKSRMCAKRLISEAAGNSSVPLYLYKDIERATNGFSEKQRLGTGAYGTVYSGKLHSNEWVAIKKIRHRSNESSEQVMNEIKLLSSVSHPNLVRLLGCCIEKDQQILVYEFMPNGTLAQHLQRERGCILPWAIRLTIAAETANAIAYLHSSVNPPIFHRDIKSSNILLDYSFKSKVADFGLSRFGMTEDSHVSTTPQGTPGYVDPQYHQNFHLSDKSDVYSFGVVLVEIITAMKAVDFSRPHSDINLAVLAVERIGKGRIDEIIDPYLEPNSDAWTLTSLHQVAELAFRCLSFHRDMRPSMMEVAEELEQIRAGGWALDGTGSSRFSCCSSNLLASEKATVAAVSRALVAAKAGSPVSLEDSSWPSRHSSSSSTNSLLCNPPN